MGSGSVESRGTGNSRSAGAVRNYFGPRGRCAGEDADAVQAGGGGLGSGKQWMSWVTLEDVVGILRFAIENASVKGATNIAPVMGAISAAPVRGPINMVSPRPVQNSEFTKILAKTVHRPALFP